MNPGEKRVLNAKRSEWKRARLVPRQLLQELRKEWPPHGLERSIEALIRPVVREEVERVLAERAITFQGGIPLKKQITGSSAREFRLQFKTNPAAKSFTESNLVDGHSDTICVMLIDKATSQPVTTGPESVAQLEVVPLMGDFNTPEEQEWSTEEFERHVEKEREGKGPLLVGDLIVHLKDGMGTLGQMYFTDNSSFTRSKKFRLGVRVAQDNEHGFMSVREGKSQAFTVIDSRGRAYMKHDTPAPTDDVWRLRNIRKDGPYHKKLSENGIITVEDFLSCLETRPDFLKDVLGKMRERDYQDTIDHAKKCIIGDELYIYQVERPPYESLIFNPNYQVMGAVAQGHYVGLEMVDDTDKVHIDGLVKSAYDHWYTDVTECTLENVAEPSMPAPPGTVDGSLANGMIDVAATLQEAPDWSFGVERVTSLEPMAGPDRVDGDVTAQWSSQEHSSEFDMAGLSDDLRIELTGLIDDGEVASQVQYVISEEYGEPFELLTVHDPRPPASIWWLRIRSAVRCALFIRKMQLARSL